VLSNRICFKMRDYLLADACPAKQVNQLRALRRPFWLVSI
jgi:hypothetical protein